jgi:hypothetical protein
MLVSQREPYTRQRMQDELRPRTGDLLMEGADTFLTPKLRLGEPLSGADSPG